MIVSGTVYLQNGAAGPPHLRQMAAPKWVIAMGACASTGGMYRSYAVLQGVDRLLPVDVYSAAARRGRRPCSTRWSSCRRRSGASRRPQLFRAQ